MPIDFPPSPQVGDTFFAPNGVTYTWNGVLWVAAGGGSFVDIAGDTMTGPLILSGDPAVPLGAATKQYVDAMLAGGGDFLPLTGGTLTGPLILAADPLAPLGAATKQYADLMVPKAGGVMTGNLVMGFGLRVGATAEHVKFDSGVLRLVCDSQDAMTFSTAANTVRSPWIFNLTTAQAANVRVASDGALANSISSGAFKIDREKIVEPMVLLMKLNPLTFASTHEVDAGRRLAGFIAEEVSAALPEAQMDGGRNYDDRAVLAVLTAAVQAMARQLSYLQEVVGLLNVDEFQDEGGAPCH